MLVDQNTLNTILVAIVAFYTVRSFTKIDKAIDKLFNRYDEFTERLKKIETEHDTYRCGNCSNNEI